MRQSYRPARAVPNDEDIEEVLGAGQRRASRPINSPTDQLNAGSDPHPILAGDAHRGCDSQSHMMINGSRHLRRPGHHPVMFPLLAMRWQPNG
jgi:hypothetical protein